MGFYRIYMVVSCGFEPFLFYTIHGHRGTSCDIFQSWLVVMCELLCPRAPVTRSRRFSGDRRPERHLFHTSRQDKFKTSQIARFVWPTWGPRAPCWPHELCSFGYFTMCTRNFFHYSVRSPITANGYIIKKKRLSIISTIDFSFIQCLWVNSKRILCVQP